MMYSNGANSKVLSDSLGNDYADLKYVVYTEVGEDQIQDFLNDTEMVGKCDCFALMYEDGESSKFLENVINKLPRLVPKILI